MRDYVRGLLKAAGESPVAGAIGVYAVLLYLVGAVRDTPVGLQAALTEAGALIVLAVALVQTEGHPSPSRFAAFMRSGANLPVVAFVLVVWARVLGSELPGPGIQEGLRYTAGLAIFMAVSYRVRRTKHLSLVRDALLTVLWLVSLTSLLDAMSGDIDATGPFGRRELLASAVALLAPLAAGQAVMGEQPGVRLAAGLGLVLGVASLLLAGEPTACYAAAAGTAAMGLLAVYAIGRKGGSITRQTERQRAWVAITVAVASVGLSQTVFGTAVSAQPENLDAELQHRTRTRVAVARDIGRRPVLGSGSGLYPYVLHDRVAAPREPAAAVERPSVSEQAYSLWLQTAADTGLIGAGALGLVFVALVVGAVHRAWRMDVGIRQNLLVSAAGAAVAAAIDGALSPAWQYAPHSSMLFLVLGLGSGMLRPHTASAQLRPGRSPLAFAAAALCVAGCGAVIATMRFAPSQTFEDRVRPTLEAPQRDTDAGGRPGT